MKNFLRDCFVASLLAMTFLATACQKQPVTSFSPTLTQPSMTQERITFQTSDNVTIVGDFSAPAGAKRAVLLLHMMPAVRSSWKPLSKLLGSAGFATLAIDLRGHGESVTLRQAQGDNVMVSLSNHDTLDYKKFSDAEHQASRLDIDAAMNFLKSKRFAESSINFAGASIGANLALDALYRYSSTNRAVLLSPGLDYRGVTTETSMKNLTANQKVWIVTAEEDSYSAKSAIALQQLQKETSTVTIFNGSDHGTNLFNSQPQLIPEIIAFLNS